MMYMLRAHEEQAQRSLVRRVTRRGDIEHATAGAPKWGCAALDAARPDAPAHAPDTYTQHARMVVDVFAYVYRHMVVCSYTWCI